MRIRPLAALPAAVLLGLGLGLTSTPAHADTPQTLSDTTTVGLHNTYSPDAFDYLADALDTNTSLIELDVWDDIVTHEWKVSHSNPLGNDNNCVTADSPDHLRTGQRNKDLAACLDDVRVWFGAHPGHAGLTIKIEMKAGFESRAGLGPTTLDNTIHDHLGDLVVTPAELLAMPTGGSYASLDAAARADNWPTLAGRVLLEVIPGTVEKQNPTDTLWTDVEYARHLRDLADAGSLDTAQVFPSVLGAAAPDPRTRYSDADLRSWFVVFDGDAATYLAGIDTAWYDARHYILIMTDAQNVPPVIDDTDPSPDQASARVGLLATAHASIVSCDWTGLPDVLGEHLPRG